MNSSNSYKKGLRDGIPIALGYFAVSFTLGIAAREAGLTAFQATLMSFTNSTSAGEFAAISAISAGSVTYLEMAVMQAVINLRYLLMSCALSQKIDTKVGMLHRLIMGGGITDEIFGISVSVTDKLSPFYMYGAMSLAIPSWAAGTCFGVVLGSVLPANVISALSIALYGMFLAVIIPPARDNKIIALIVAVSMAASYLFSIAPVLKEISSGMKVIILTVIISMAAAFLFPIEEENADAE